jgi:hypothetical protein
MRSKRPKLRSRPGEGRAANSSVRQLTALRLSLSEPHPIDMFPDQNLGMVAIANAARSPGHHVGLMRKGIAAPRRVVEQG